MNRLASPQAAALKASAEIGVLANGPFPSRLEDFGSLHGLHEIREVDLGMAVDALLFPSGEGYVAVLNSKHGTTRKRFSLAHEIGHILLAEVDSVKFRKPSCGGTAFDPVERTCNQLATEMLMPKDAFVQKANAVGWTLQGVPQLTPLFGTSFEATVRRLVELSPTPLGFIKWRLDPKTGKPIHVHSPNVSHGGVRITSFDRRYLLIDLPALRGAYEANSISSGTVPFEVLVRRPESTVGRTFRAESMGFGAGRQRLVYTLVHLA